MASLQPMAGALTTSIVLGLFLGACLSPSVQDRVDKLAMTPACSGAEPIYARPDGSYWVWRGGLRQVYFSSGDSCRWDTYPQKPPL